MGTQDLEQLWPELFDGMDARQRRDVLLAFEDGAEPSYEDVKDLCELAVGAIDATEYGDRSLAAARHTWPDKEF